MTMVDKALDWAGNRIARRLADKRKPTSRTPFHTDIVMMQRVLRPADVLLVDGEGKISSAIRYLTQSSWSHAAIYVGDILETCTEDGERHCLIEANVGEGVVSAPLSKYTHFPTRICRPVNLTPEDRDLVINFMKQRIGLTYDMRNIVDLLRYLIPQPPVPKRWRRRMLALGSGDPTRAICSTLIAQAFQQVRYPILPRIKKVMRGEQGAQGYSSGDILHIRHHSLFTPSDFDISPYFDVVKPMVAEGFNYKGLTWGDLDEPDARRLQISLSARSAQSQV